jgi:hypothetical protein
VSGGGSGESAGVVDLSSEELNMNVRATVLNETTGVPLTAFAAIRIPWAL